MRGDGHVEARALRCPGCGGDLERGARRCRYCAIQLASVRCWRCFELAFAGSSHCAGCGARLGLEADRGAGEERCPSCASERLHSIDVGDHAIRECMGCGGVLVDHSTLEAITHAREAEAGMRALDHRVQRAERAGTDFRYRRCPSCDVLMTPRNFGRCSGVIVDVCREHGVWFDADELTAVLSFVASGGLREARERDRRGAREEIARRRTEALSQQAMMASGPAEDEFVVSSAAALLGAILELFR
jgi:Zn-finger nucleic acid-binding protein